MGARQEKSVAGIQSKAGQMKRAKAMFVVLCGGLICVFLLVYMKTQPRMGTDLKAFQEGKPSYLLADIPEVMENFRFINKSGLFYKYSIYSYTLNEEAYEAHKEAILKRYSVDLQDEEDLRYGYAHWYGMNVSDINADNPEYGLNNFPFGLPFDKVVGNDINEYEVLIYHPTGTGTQCFGVLVDDARYEVVCFYSNQIR